MDYWINGLMTPNVPQPKLDAAQPASPAAALAPARANPAGASTEGDRAGVRPSSGAATSAGSGVAGVPNVVAGSKAAAPEGGRTPCAPPTTGPGLECARPRAQRHPRAVGGRGFPT